jgi:hypothetical protein
MRQLFLVTISILLAACPADGTVAAPPDNQNAATWYSRSTASLQHLTADDWKIIETFRAQPEGAPSPELRAVLSKAQTMMNEVRRGSKQPYSDFNLPYDQGFEMLLPHLSDLRQVARIMQTDAYVKLHDGDAQGAADRVASLYHVGEHLGQDRVLISSLVGQAIFDVGDDLVGHIIERGALDANTGAELARALGDFDPHDPFRYAEALAVEQNLALSTMESMFTGEAHDDALLQLLNLDGEVNEEFKSITPQGLEHAITQYDDLMTEMNGLFVSRDEESSRTRLIEIEKEIESGEHGIIVNIMMPALGKLYERKLEAMRTIDARLELLRSVADGSIDVLEEANAARWYVQAACELRKRPAEQLQALRRFDANPTRPFTEPVLSLCANAKDINDLITEGTRMRQCDFAPLRPLAVHRPHAAPPYAGAVRDLVRFLVTDTIRLLRAGDNAAVVQRLNELFAMAAHISSDPVFTSSLTSHHLFVQIANLATEAQKLDIISAEQLAHMYGVARRMSHADPFGYIAATVDARERFFQYYNDGLDRKATNREKMLSVIRRSIEACSADDMYYIALIIETMAQSSNADRSAEEPAYIGIHDLINLDAVDRARHQFAEAAPLLAMYNLKALRDLQRPTPAALRDRMRKARRDLRAGLAAMKNEAATTPATSSATSTSR